MKHLIYVFVFLVSINLSHSQEIEWYGSQIIKDSPYKPNEDKYGKKWHEKSFDDNSWTQISKLPDENWRCDYCDRFYRGYFDIESIDLENINYFIKFESDDGIWVYVNGKYLGHWGGEMHKPKCVNHCYDNERVEPVYINDYLSVGRNVIAVHVSDCEGGEYFNLYLQTKDKRK
jgi:hypothetical protein